ncbi:lysylphosphatidylglycerol synthase transmembrane domain-containing protein [Aquimarina rhabdastrellae]
MTIPLKYRKILKIILPLLLGVFLIIYSISSATPEERQKTLSYILEANPLWIILSICLGLLSHLSRAYRSKIALLPLGYSIKLSNSFMALMIGYVANLGIPRSGELLRGGTISSYENIPFEKVFGTIITERVLDLVMLLLVITTAAFFKSEYLFLYLEKNNINPLITLGALLLLILFGIVFLKILNKATHPFLVKLRNFGLGILDGIKSILKLKRKGAYIFHTFMIWILYIFVFDVIKYTIPETANLDIGTTLIAFIAGSVAMTTTNGGIGLFPIAIASTLAISSIDRPAGEAFGWILWGSQTLMNLVVGGLSFLFLPIVNRNRPK